MNDDLEARLREALRPVEPSAGFTGRVLMRVQDQHRQRQVRRRWRIPASLAASMVLGSGLYLRVQQHRETAAGLEARRQVIEALRLTDQKLDIAYQTVKEASGS